MLTRAIDASVDGLAVTLHGASVPREIDEALLQHPAVLDAAAVGIPDAKYGREILACIVLRNGAAADEAELRA